MFKLKNTKLFLTVLLITISGTVSVYASHIIGGKMTYRFLGANSYELKLTIYRDCADPFDFDNPAPITVFDNTTNAIISNHQLALFHRDTIHPNNPDPCFIPPLGICVEEGYYLDTVFLPINTSGYTATYQRCCHNASVLNIISPFFYGTTITTNIPPQINNSANFLNFPPIYICVNDTFNYSFISTDVDGDSLVYQLCNPLCGVTNLYSQPNPASPPVYPPISWSSGFSASNPIVTSSGIVFNSSTGIINFIPTMQGQFAVGICVNEYRSGILLNTNRLEIQFNVVPCYLVSSIPTATNLCEGLAINFQNGSTNATAYHWDFGVIPIFTDTSNIASPIFTFPSFGTYSISLIAINTNYGICKDTTLKVIQVNPLLAPTLAPSFYDCYKSNNINFTLSGFYDPSATFNWDLGSNATPSISILNNPSVHFDTLSQNISVIVKQFGCSDTLNSNVSFINPIPAFSSSELNCQGSNLIFNSYSHDATNVFWDFGVIPISTDTSNLNTAIFTYPAFGIYTITLIAFNGICSDTVTSEISVNDTLTLNEIIYNGNNCLNNNIFNFNANGTYGAAATFNWIFGSSANTFNSTLENPTSITYTSTGNHLVKLAVIENGCSKHQQTIITVFSNPKAKYISSDSIGCQPLEINFTNQSISTIPFISSWNIENVNYNSLDKTYSFYNSGFYSIYLTVIDTNNCTDTIKKINLINVLSKPKALVYANPIVTDITNPLITFNDISLSTHSTNFNFGDNLTSNQISNYHTYTDTGTYNYSLIIINNFGCIDTTNGVIIIKALNSLYIPNSFTPNSDNLNDIFKPIIPYYKNATMQIFDRWGTLIFKTNDIQNGWDGTNKNSQNKNDVYIYKIDIEYLDGSVKNLIGNVSLIR